MRGAGREARKVLCYIDCAADVRRRTLRRERPRFCRGITVSAETN
ncbi:hypothetical protein BRPE64_ACDS12060 [Caballeronia insecticola]|uniref:Uncharacterized protein n=1 Tax=Caballeronia insecticola TaxID=758793 RepID=R4WPZ1_9BURK|nr:hypothetical protein BRPE64_ACDS12060 [Caballeronia insecticola]